MSQITINDKTIEVKDFLPTDKKYVFIMTTVDEATEKDTGLISEILLDLFFNLNLVSAYTDMVFDPEEMKNPADLYDKLVADGTIDAIIKAIPEKEYSTLFNYVEKEIAKREEYAKRIAGVIGSAISALPEVLEKVNAELKDLDTDKYANVINFAKANGLSLGSKTDK
jgi:hypothetical protein